MKNWLRHNGLSITVLSIFLVLLVGQCLTGWHSHNEERLQHGAAVLSLGEYLGSGHFVEATSENWESEFLQMAAYVLLTVFLRQRGSSESKSFSGDEVVDRDPRRDRGKPDAPYPVRRGGWLLVLYEWSLSLAFFFMFLLAFVGHVAGGLQLENDERALDGLAPVTLTDFLSSAEFWFQSLQNWQSEFLAVAAIVVLSIWLRQRGSPESKPVSAPHAQTVMPSTSGDALAAIFDLQRLFVVARSVTDRAWCIDARQEQQLHHHKAFALGARHWLADRRSHLRLRYA